MGFDGIPARLPATATDVNAVHRALPPVHSRSLAPLDPAPSFRLLDRAPRPSKNVT